MWRRGRRAGGVTRGAMRAAGGASARRGCGSAYPRRDERRRRPRGREAVRHRAERENPPARPRCERGSSPGEPVARDDDAEGLPAARWPRSPVSPRSPRSRWAARPSTAGLARGSPEAASGPTGRRNRRVRRQRRRLPAAIVGRRSGAPTVPGGAHATWVSRCAIAGAPPRQRLDGRGPPCSARVARQRRRGAGACSWAGSLRAALSAEPSRTRVPWYSC
jgi:hypothetical protein